MRQTCCKLKRLSIFQLLHFCTHSKVLKMCFLLIIYTFFDKNILICCYDITIKNFFLFNKFLTDLNENIQLIKKLNSSKLLYN